MAVSALSQATKASLSGFFTRCVKGYHLLNSEPIKEAVWEDINVQILEAAGCSIASQARGSHRSGADISCSLGDFSNKSAKYDVSGSSFQISSYRLTAVCSDKQPGAPADILAEIQKRTNYTYYSIVVREEKEESYRYDWYLIPSDYPALKASAYTWSPTTGQRGKNKGAQVGWSTNEINGSSMSITFSMSSQLWLSVKVTDELKSFIVGSTEGSKKRKYNYIELGDRETDSAASAASK